MCTSAPQPAIDGIIDRIREDEDEDPYGRKAFPGVQKERCEAQRQYNDKTLSTCLRHIWITSSSKIRE
jgi:hypothetical protein